MSARIGITIGVDYGGPKRAYSLNEQYAKAIAAAGGVPVLLPALDAGAHAGEYAALVDGLLCPGGADISPRMLDEDPIPQVTSSDVDRDLLELELVRLMDAQKKPVLGICKGLQVVNVALGGTLIQDIPTQTQSRICHVQDNTLRSELTHKVLVEPGTLLHAIMGEAFYVNSFHHQAVREPGRGLLVSARARDGLIEAMESPDGLLFAVQWHPEELWRRYPAFSSIFTSFVERVERAKR